MLLSIGLLLVFIVLAWRAAPREKQEDALVHGAGQIGLLAAVALFGVDYFTSFFYATGEMMGALHPYGLQKYGYIAVAVIALANFVFGALVHVLPGYLQRGRWIVHRLDALPVTRTEPDRGGGADPGLRPHHRRLDALGRRQLLSITNAYSIQWFCRFAMGAALAAITWYLTIRGRGESAQVVFTAAGYLRPAHRDHGHRAGPGQFAGRRRAAAMRSRPVRHEPGTGAVPPADGLHEGHGRAERAGGDVEWDPVRQGRGLLPGALGKEAPAPPSRLVELLQRQVGHRPSGADLASCSTAA